MLRSVVHYTFQQHLRIFQFSKIQRRQITTENGQPSLNQTNFFPHSNQRINESFSNRNQGFTFKPKTTSDGTSSNIRKNPQQFIAQLGLTLNPINWETENLPPVTKNLLDKNFVNNKISFEEVERWRKENQITIFGRGCPPPVLSFDQLTFFPEVIVQELKKLYSTPTVIQSQSWPLIMEGRDTIGSAETGSGKTLAFALPALVHIQKQSVRNEDGPVVLVLCPTRELTQQVAQVFFHYAQLVSLKVGFCHGGPENRTAQIQRILQKPQIVVATPGRLIDFLERRYTSLKKTSYVVLDEADRMLDMGFEPQIRVIMNQIRPDRQTLMWSATWPKEVQILANDFLKDPVRIHVGPLNLSANPDVTQKIIICEDLQNRDSKFLETLKKLNLNEEKLLIFTKTKKTADWLRLWLQQTLQIDSAVIHGDKIQKERNEIMRKFRRGNIRILIATDLASRGLDVQDITLVINYDFPSNIENYIHRIGRTGRAGKKGTAISFFTPENFHLVYDLLSVMHESHQEIPAELKQVLANQKAIDSAKRNAEKTQAQHRLFKKRPGLVPTPHRLTKSFTPRIDTTSQTSAFKTNTNN